MSTKESIEFQNVDAGLRVVKLKLWDKLVPIAFIVNSEPHIPLQVVGNMLNVDLDGELNRLIGTSAFLSQKIDFISWNDPDVVELLGDVNAPWIALSSVSLWMTGLGEDRLKDAQAMQTLQFLIMLLHGHPTALHGVEAAGILSVVGMRAS